MASALMPIVGKVHECKTSAAVTRTRMYDQVGKTMRWSVSRRR